MTGPWWVVWRVPGRPPAESGSARGGDRLLLQQREQVLLDLEIARAVHHGVLVSGPRERNRDHLADGRAGPTGHHHHARRGLDRLVALLRDDQGGLRASSAAPHPAA